MHIARHIHRRGACILRVTFIDDDVNPASLSHLDDDKTHPVPSNVRCVNRPRGFDLAENGRILPVFRNSFRYESKARNLSSRAPREHTAPKAIHVLIQAPPVSAFSQKSTRLNLYREKKSLNPALINPTSTSSCSQPLIYLILQDFLHLDLLFRLFRLRLEGFISFGRPSDREFGTERCLCGKRMLRS